MSQNRKWNELTDKEKQKIGAAILVSFGVVLVVYLIVGMNGIGSILGDVAIFFLLCYLLTKNILYPKPKEGTQ